MYYFNVPVRIHIFVLVLQLLQYLLGVDAETNYTKKKRTINLRCCSRIMLTNTSLVVM